MTDFKYDWSTTGFKPGEYKMLLSAMLDRGYSAVSLDAVNCRSKVMFLRHDIDLCPARALAMARQEAELGLTATYYFLVSTRLYSIATKSVRSILSEITELGHEIGLHFDAAQYSLDEGNLDKHVAEECKILVRGGSSGSSSSPTTDKSTIEVNAVSVETVVSCDCV